MVFQIEKFAEYQYPKCATYWFLQRYRNIRMFLDIADALG